MILHSQLLKLANDFVLLLLLLILPLYKISLSLNCEAAAAESQTFFVLRLAADFLGRLFPV
jgi:hypothetical protein